MPGEKDAPGFEVQVHQVEGNAALEVTIDSVQNDLAPNIDYLQIREVRLRNRLVHSLVFFYAAKEVGFGLFRGSGRIVRVPRTNFERNVRGNDSRVVTRRLDEYHHYSPFASYPRFNGSSTYWINRQKLAQLEHRTLTYGSVCYSWHLGIRNECGATTDPYSTSYQGSQHSPRPSTIESASQDYLMPVCLSFSWLRRFRG